MEEFIIELNLRKKSVSAVHRLDSSRFRFRSHISCGFPFFDIDNEMLVSESAIVYFLLVVNHSLLSPSVLSFIPVCLSSFYSFSQNR